jgi:hypothetical protein
MAVSTTIDSTLGVVSTLVTSGNSLVVTGTADFTGASVTGVTADPNVEELNDTFSASETYDCSGNVRMFKYNALAMNSNFAIAAITNLTISDNQGATIKILGSTSSDRTVTLSAMTVNGDAATVAPATIKAKNKGCGVALDVVKSGGSYFVFGSSLASE